MPPRPRLLALALAAALGASARAGPDEPDPPPRPFEEGEIAEAAFGDLARAAELFAEAARAAPDAERRGRAELRAASCLRRLGRTEEARALLLPWTEAPDASPELRRAAALELEAAGAPPTEPPPAAPAEAPPHAQVEALEREIEDLRRELERSTASESETAELLRRKDAEMARLLERLERRPSSPEEALRLRTEERERQHALSRTFARLAEQAYRDGRFADARSYLYDALQKDPENAAARALLTRLSAPLATSERLYQDVVALVALSQEVRTATLTAEIESLVELGRGRQERGDFAGSVPPLERALALLGSRASVVRAPALLRERTVELLRQAETRGVPRAPATLPPAPEDDPDAWLAPVRDVLLRAGAEAAPGLDLAFHALDPALTSAVSGLPPVPVGPAPLHFTMTGEPPPAAPLLVEWVRAAEAAAFSVPGTKLEAVGATLVARTERSAQERIAERLARLAVDARAAQVVEIGAWRAAPAAIDAALARRGAAAQVLPAGARSTVLQSAEVDRLRAELDSGDGALLGSATLRATPLRPFRLSAGTAAASVDLDLLPVPGEPAGLGLSVAVRWTPPGRTDGARLGQTAAAGGVLAPGAALVLSGLCDPADPQRAIVVVVRVGEARRTEAEGSAGPRGPAPLPEPASPGFRAAELLLPPSVAGLAEVVPEALPGVRPVAGRRDALAARLAAVARGAAMVELRDDRVLVVGPEAAHDGVRRLLAQLDAARGLQRFEVVVRQIDAAEERLLFERLPRFEPAASGALAFTVLRDDAERRVADLSAPGVPLALLEPVVAVPPTGRGDVSRVVRQVYRRELEDAGDGPGWRRTESAWVDEGLLVALRPFGVTVEGDVDLDLSLRAALVSSRERRERATALGQVSLLEPGLVEYWGDLSLRVPRGRTLVLARMKSPFPPAGARDRLLVLVRPLP